MRTATVICQDCNRSFEVRYSHRTTAQRCAACRLARKYKLANELRRKAKPEYQLRVSTQTVDRRAIYDYIRAHPGVNPGAISLAIGHSYSAVYSALPSMDDMGLYLSEDHRGGLYVYEEAR